MIQIKSTLKTEPALTKSLNDCWQKVLKRPEAGFTQLSEDAEGWLAIEDRVNLARPSQRVLILGIGGSSLGPQVIHQCFRNSSATEFYFLESPDPHLWQSLGDLKSPAWRDKHVVIISKSGNTLETLSWVERLNAFDPLWLENSQCTVIASPGDAHLQSWAKREGIPCLWIPKNVGGRFSVLTAVGMFPAALMGLKIGDFREGASWALKHPELATQLSSAILDSWQREEWITQMWTYAQGLSKFGEWWQQLWGESLAKKTKRNGEPAPRASTPMACAGPRDQHSLVQQLMEGARDKFVFITRVKSVENSDDEFKASLFHNMPFSEQSISLGKILGAEAQAFEKSLAESKIPFSTVQIESLNEKSLGGLLMLWQMTTAQLGEAMGIDPFNQPGVELGKTYAAKILRS